MNHVHRNLHQLAEKQKQIAELKLQQTQTENRNRLISILLGITVVVVAAFSFLGLRLRQANTRLQQLTQAREYFLGIVAHNVRRPLSSYHGMAEMVNDALKIIRLLRRCRGPLTNRGRKSNNCSTMSSPGHCLSVKNCLINLCFSHSTSA